VRPESLAQVLDLTIVCYSELMEGWVTGCIHGDDDGPCSSNIKDLAKETHIAQPRVPPTLLDVRSTIFRHH
jgi:hypothetical protein